LDQQKIKCLYVELGIVKNQISIRFTISWEYHISGKLDLSNWCFIIEIEQRWQLRFSACAKAEPTSWPFIISQSQFYMVFLERISTISRIVKRVAWSKESCIDA
jgi:hypothetical protein